jgi:hypothetical protein
MFGCDRSITKGTLLEEQSTFYTVPRLVFHGSFWKSALAGSHYEWWDLVRYVCRERRSYLSTVALLYMNRCNEVSYASTLDALPVAVSPAKAGKQAFIVFTATTGILALQGCYVFPNCLRGTKNACGGCSTCRGFRTDVRCYRMTVVRTSFSSRIYSVTRQGHRILKERGFASEYDVVRNHVRTYTILTILGYSFQLAFSFYSLLLLTIFKPKFLSIDHLRLEFLASFFFL